MMLFGGNPVCFCVIKCNGQGAVVSIKPQTLDFGNVTLLKNENRSLTLTNESPISAEATLSLVSFITFILTYVSDCTPTTKYLICLLFVLLQPESSIFTITPTKLELEPLEKTTVSVSTYLCNPGKHSDSLTVEITNAETIYVKLFAFGVGTSILCEPPLPENYDLGILLTRRSLSYPMMFTNKGRRFHKIAWSDKLSLKPVRGAAEVVEKRWVGFGNR